MMQILLICYNNLQMSNSPESSNFYNQNKDIENNIESYSKRTAIVKKCFTKIEDIREQLEE